MIFNKKNWALILGIALLCTFTLLLLVTKALPRILPGRIIECSELGVANLHPNQGTVTCLRKSFVFGAYTSIILEGNKLEPSLSASFEMSKLNGSLTAQLIGAPTEPLIAEDENGKVVWSSNGTGTNWTAATRVSLPDLTQVQVLMFRFKSPTKFEIVVSPMQVGESSIVNILSFLLVLFGVVILSRRQQSFVESLTGILLVYSAYIMFCGMPFGSSTGWFDSGDDTSYMHWAYNLGYQLNPDLKSTEYIKSWSLSHNHHPWGTGLLLAPFVFLVKLMKSGMTPSVIHFGFMNFGIIVMGFLSVLVLWRSFYQLFPSRLTLPVVFLGVYSTSMVKWLFMRNIFSHVPELFSLSLLTLFLVKTYGLKDRRFKNYLGICLSLILATHVRRENVMFIVIPALLEILLPQENTKWSSKWFHAIVFVAIGSIAHFSLDLTNYFTKLNRFFAEAYTQQHLFKIGIWPAIQLNFSEVLWKESYGLFYWKNSLPWLSLICIAVGWKHWRVGLPLLVVSVGSIAMCVFHEFPNGMEWQNRFLLKLIPIFLFAVLYLIQQSGLVLRFLIVAYILSSFILETISYRLNQLPKGMAFYNQDLHNHAIVYPQSWPGTLFIVFQMPLAMFLFLGFFGIGYMLFRLKSKQAFK